MDSSQLYCHETDFTERLDDADSITNQDVQLIKGNYINSKNIQLLQVVIQLY